MLRSLNLFSRRCLFLVNNNNNKYERILFIYSSYILYLMFRFNISASLNSQQQKILTVNLSDTEWKKKLTNEQYRILRQKDTEYPGTGKYNKHFEKGIYKCAGCGEELYE